MNSGTDSSEASCEKIHSTRKRKSSKDSERCNSRVWVWKVTWVRGNIFHWHSFCNFCELLLKLFLFLFLFLVLCTQMQKRSQFKWLCVCDCSKVSLVLDPHTKYKIQNIHSQSLLLDQERLPDLMLLPLCLSKLSILCFIMKYHSWLLFVTVHLLVKAESSTKLRVKQQL